MRRTNGEGTVYYSESKKLWVAQYHVKVEFSGIDERITKYGKTRKEAKDKVDQVIKELNNENYVKKSFITLKDIGESMLNEEYKLNLLGESSFSRKQYSFKIILEQPISTIRIQEIKEKDVKNFLYSLTKYSDSTISKVYSLLNTFFEKAIWDKIISVNPMDKRSGIRKPKSIKPSKKILAFTLEEHKDLLNALAKERNRELSYKEKKNTYTTQLFIALNAGLRMGEINALELPNIDFVHHKIIVNNSTTRDINFKTKIGGKTKTKAGERKVPMTDFVEDELHYYIDNVYPLIKGKSEDKNYKQLLFLDVFNYSFVTTNQVNCYFKRICEKYEVCSHEVNQHMLRHTYATRQIESGIAPKVLQKFMGHSDIKTTLDTYCDVFDDFSDLEFKNSNNYLEKNNLLQGLNLSLVG